MASKGWDKDVFSLVNELPASQQAMALCQNRIQAMIYTVGHPNPSVAHAASACNTPIVEVTGPEIDRLRAAGQPTVPSLLGEEMATNPFLRADEDGVAAAVGLAGADPVSVFAEVRKRKDSF